MTVKKIAQLLKQALLEEGKMEYALYEHELAEQLSEGELPINGAKVSL